jgi:membrane-bound inhibitor of C-type lysozyme
MKKKVAGLLTATLLAVLVLYAFAGAAETALSVVGGEPAVYECDNGDEVVARYYMLSDESLRFVKLLFPDGTEYTLPQVLSASGARYTDDIELLWWIKGDDAYVEKRDETGEWRPLYSECRARP